MYSRIIAQINKYNTRIAVAPLNYIHTNKIKIVTPLAPNKGRKETQRNPKNSNVRRREEKKCKINKIERTHRNQRNYMNSQAYSKLVLIWQKSV